MNQAEKREYLRAELGVFLNEKILSDFQIGRTVDICEAGIRYVKPVGAFQRLQNEVTVEFQLPDDDRTLRARGRVVLDRLDKSLHTTSLVFTALSASTATRIRNYVIGRKRAEIFDGLRKRHLGEAVA